MKNTFVALLGAALFIVAIASGIASAAGALFGLAKTRLAPNQFSQVAKAVPVLTSFVTKSGGASVGKLLAGALK